MFTVIVFLIVLAVLIFVHELGHFLLARACGIRVDEFALGFGPNLFSWKRGETTYGLNLIPFGGYVKIFGENPDVESISGPDKNRSFVNKPRWKQAIVLIAGIFFNFLFAWLLYTIVFTSGVTASTAGFENYSQYFNNPRIMVTYVAAQSPAEKAGLKVGDTLAGKSVQSVQDMISSSTGPVTLSFARNNEASTTTILPIPGLIQGKQAIGIAMETVVELRLPIYISVWEGLHYTGIMIRDTAVGLYTFIANIFRGTANFSDVAGPVGIAGIVGNAAVMGLPYLLMITALISINLGVINLIPFPALDGGRLLFVLIEGTIRRPISPKISNTLNAIGFALLMLLMVVVTYKDIAKLFK